ncbi:hypothetical protein HYH03_015217 [Edaphochlamys debaryana]|uniref:SAM domain-containing protein n=1 Tax=Edaphochlamys debaryana TaxID=47281 RepID=A0A835XJX8_9CHLO|nr:hypothetical protein HYH03_015217 [Edaphochlamys debaryana]|eukprot:KAG2486122.1 hypothetical protein HYH03_015217 [Edaphochlamys debaryana]
MGVVEKWSTAEVVDFLKKQGLGEVCGAFESNGVTGLDLMLLTEEDLRSMLNISKQQAADVKRLAQAADSGQLATAGKVKGAGVEAWQTPEVCAFLRNNGLDSLVPTFEANGVTGADIVLLTDDELRSMLNISKLQAIKVKKLAEAANIDTEAAVQAAAGQMNLIKLDDADSNYKAAAMPRISDRPEDYGDASAQAEMRRATSTRVVTGVVVGSAVPQHSGPSLPSGTGLLKMDAKVVEYYTASVDLIMRLESQGVAQELPAARQKLDVATKQLKLQEAKFKELSKEQAEANAKLAELQEGKWYPGKFIMGSDNREEKLKEKSEKAQGISAKVRAVGAQLEELHVQVDKAAKRVKELEGQCQQLDERRAWVAALLQSAFAGGAVGDERENAIETEVAALGPKVEEVRRYKAVYSQAYEAIKGSKQAMEKSMQLLQHAAQLANVDMMNDVFRPMPMHNSMGGMMVDMAKRQNWEQGVQMCRVAADLAIKARTMVLDMPRVKIEKMKQLQAGGVPMDVFFDNIVSDMAAARKIRDALAKVQSCMEDVAYGEQWLRGWLQNRIDQDLRTLESQLTGKRNELHVHRTRLLNEWIKARAAGANREAPAAAQPGRQQTYATGYVF